jgi:hypothetical protein
MSLEGLRKFNQAYGFPINHKSASPERSRMEELVQKIFLAVPIFGVLVAHHNPQITDLNRASRAVLSTTLICLPLVFALDIIATLVTQPLQKILDHRKVKQLAETRLRATEV